MTELVRYGLVAFILFFTHFQEGITGFGCSALALPFVVLLLGLHTAVPVLVMLAAVTSLGIALESRRKIVWSECWRILLLMGIGLPIGILLSDRLPETALKFVLSLFMIVVGFGGLSGRHKPKDGLPRASRRSLWLAKSLLPIAGVAQGAFGASGPITVVYATKALPEKALFRVTLCMVALILNVALVAQWAVRSSLSGQMLRVAALCLPFTLCGMVLGNAVHYRVNEAAFRATVHVILILSGFLMLWSCLAR